MTLMQRVYYVILSFGNIISLSCFWYWPSKTTAILSLFTLAYSLVGFYDLKFSKHSLNRLYPVVAYIRYFLESFRGEIQQYFIANNTEETPFNREQRSLVYQRSKNVRDTIAFGTQRDLMATNYLSLWHSLSPTQVTEPHRRVLIGGRDCLQPYNADYLNISAMSFGALSANAIEALNLGAKIGGFYHNTGEGGVSPYHLKHGGDLVWQIGSGLFGCRNAQGQFDSESFTQIALKPQVKMIEIKLSQGAKPGHGGVLPKAKITQEIAQIRGINTHQDCVSPAVNPECQTPKDLLAFVQKLRNLSQGKPVGFKLCIGNPAEFLAICKAMLETNILPDFITIDGAEGGTGAAPVEFSNRLGLTCLESLYLVNSALIGCGIRDKITLIGAGKTASSFDLVSKIAVGADVVNAARTMMMALGCIQSLSCNTNMCPTGIATQDDARGKAIDVPIKSQRVANFQRNTIHNFFELIGSMGLNNPKSLTPEMLKRRTQNGLLLSYGALVPTLKENALINNDHLDYPWSQWWPRASSEQYTVNQCDMLKPPKIDIREHL
ncbi:FMN-binding glutamate synthase family protein [Pseudoalteromonas ulvae]|uniref:FMN-binding glutamate synthase family protein n=1 Tax=Pseudoalteromonas ulvae TaxID=107327 RepID=A0A244CQA7_PSEDV|nr:FMN-binding glutamate synthase family protein [Pseudoalteromonas ulvae]OUL57801.1 FMN-binding glutamate synthase family protein [Pseudoalteromonas ulvae]